MHDRLKTPYLASLLSDAVYRANVSSYFSVVTSNMILSSFENIILTFIESHLLCQTLNPNDFPYADFGPTFSDLRVV